ncbi:Septin-domain-containing protein [Blakeslea trispora]|nr:Septin-domain-containing protein [Blakeslea trispora]
MQDTLDTYDILSIENSLVKNDQNQTFPFRIIICGDSGTGKTTLANLLALSENINRKPSLEPIEIKNNNMCIIDTCGYGALSKAEVVFKHTQSYLERQFIKTNQLFSPLIKEEDQLISVLEQASQCFTHVNVCLYLIMGRLKPVDIEYMRTMQDLVNIIPVIIQTDLTLGPDIIARQRLEIMDHLEANEIKCFQTDPFILDWSILSRSFHGTLSLRQLLQQYSSQLRQFTVQRFISWRKRQANLSTQLVSSHSSSDSSASSHAGLENNRIRISQYITHRRQSMEKELLRQEKKLRQELEVASRQRKMEIVLREMNSLMPKEESEVLLGRSFPSPIVLTLLLFLSFLVFLLLLLVIKATLL